MGKTILNYDNITDSEIGFYNKYGYLMLPNLVKKEFIRYLQLEVMEALEYVGVDTKKLNKATSVADKLRHSNDYCKESLLDQLINGKETIALVSQLIGGNAIRYFPFAVVKAGGGGGDFHMHQDNNYSLHDPVEGSINIWVALVDMNPDNGCLQIVPESHKLGVLEWENAKDGDEHRKIKEKFENPLPVRLNAGDAVAFSRLTVHGSGANKTSEPRIAYALQYHRDDVNFFDTDTNKWKSLEDEYKGRFAPRKA